ncbi:MAG: lysylphosphatidylglycerol synthase transmembrane domain-containing protein [Armatimonadota bacterium]|nr:lysylphosphatidylglycerol synthase transmembrane domain-containing protein [Armatimonadota bacterium]
MGVRRSLVLRLAVSLVLVGALLWRTDRARLATTIGALDLVLFGAAAMCYVVAQGVSTLRWQLLLRAEGISASLGRLFVFYLEGMFLNLFLPTLIGGDVVRAHRVYVHTERNEAAVASILVERLSGMAALLVIAWGSLALGPQTVAAGPILGVSIMLGLGLVVMFNRSAKSVARRVLGRPAFVRLEEGITAFYRALVRYRSRPGILAQVFGISLGVQALAIFACFLVGRSLGLSAPFGLYLALIPLATIAAMVPVSLGGLGVREGAMVYLFGNAGVPVADALGLSLGWFLATIVCSAPGALVFARRGAGRMPAVPQPAGR